MPTAEKKNEEKHGDGGVRTLLESHPCSLRGSLAKATRGVRAEKWLESVILLERQKRARWVVDWRSWACRLLVDIYTEPRGRRISHPFSIPCCHSYFL